MSALVILLTLFVVQRQEIWSKKGTLKKCILEKEWVEKEPVERSSPVPSKPENDLRLARKPS